MNVSIVRCGHVRTTVAAYLADCGHEIVNVDSDEAVVENINAGVAPDTRARTGRTRDETRWRAPARDDNDAIADTEVTFLVLPTPSTDHGSIDLSTMNASTRSVGDLLAGKE